MEALCRHLSASERFTPVMLMLLRGNSNQSEEMYVNILLEEPTLKGKSILVLQDYVRLAVQEGIQLYFLS